MPNDRHQATDRPEAPAVATRVVLVTAIGFLIFVAISLVLLHFFYRAQIHQTVFVQPASFAKPQLQTNEADDLAKLQAKQRGRLNGYAWVDREEGIVAIPIEEAMKRIVGLGADAFAPLDTSAPVQPAGGGKQP